MDQSDDFDGYVEALPSMLTLLRDAVYDPGPLAPFIGELRAALGAASAAAERLRTEHRRMARRAQSRNGSAGAHLRLVAVDPWTMAAGAPCQADRRDHGAAGATAV